MARKVKVSDLPGMGATCPGCHYPIHAYQDPEGMWIECDCDAGYACASTIVVEDE